MRDRAAIAPPAAARQRPIGLVIAGVVAALCVAVSVTFRMDDPDVWQHLVVGKAIWEGHAVPRAHLWSWPTYGLPAVLPSWGFRALLWPFWALGGELGLAVWRWLTTLLAFGFLAAIARRMGARGFATLVVLVVAALVFRARSQVRPETLAVVLLAIQIWILESRRRPGSADRSVWLVAVAWAWANVHLSYYIGLGLIGIHLLAERRRRLAWVALAAVAASFLNPFGWRALAQPFEYFLHWRHEPIYQTIAELAPVDWRASMRSGLPFLALGWPALIAWRATRRAFDPIEALTCAGFSALLLAGRRFAGFYAIAAAPYVARDLSVLLATIPSPRWLEGTATRAVLASAACVAVSLPTWSRPEYPPGIGFQWSQYPVRACDVMAREGVRGRSFEQYYIAGYTMWRFWPDRERLPFMDVHQSGTPEDRRLYAYVFANHDAWLDLDARHRFDYLLLDGHQASVRGDRLLDFLDADPTWSLIFRDDAGALFVRRDGPLAVLAARHGFVYAPAGDERVGPLAQVYRDRAELRPAIAAEVRRLVASSPWNARAHTIQATLRWIDGRSDSAQAELRAALRVDPAIFGAHRQLGLLALAEGRTDDAVREFEAERKLGDGWGDLDALVAQAYLRARDWKRAQTALQKELRVHPDDAAARESLEVVMRRLAAPD